MTWLKTQHPAEAPPPLPVAAFLEPASPWHCGLIYEDLLKNRWYLHVAFHSDLRRDRVKRPKPMSGAWVVPQLDPIVAEQISELCDLIWERNHSKGLPYGFCYTGACFDIEGRLQLSPEEHGLTCASFILAIFASAGIKMADLHTWPQATEKDQGWRIKVIKHIPDENHQHLLKDELAAKRFHPPEVVGACAYPWPCSYPQAQSAASLLEQSLKGR